MKYYRCELHTHTTASDGKMSAEKLIDRACECRYDAIAVTDHNTTSNAAKACALGKASGLTVIPGIEWTTFWGHLTVLGGKSKVDWRSVNPDTLAESIKKAKQAGDTVVIAHPRRMGFPLCAGCHFDYDINDACGADGYEIWSHYYPNEGVSERQQRELWYSLLKRGKRLTALYGYDWHSPDDIPPSYACTFVGAENCTAEDILGAVKAGHVYVSVGTILTCNAECDGRIYEIGDTVAGTKELTVYGTCKIDEDYRSDKPTAFTRAEVHTANGVYSCDIDEKGNYNITVQADGYAVVEIFGIRLAKEQRLAITNAFFTGGSI